MKENTPNSRSGNPSGKAVLIAVVIIILGTLLLGRNLGLIEHSIFRIIVSWQTLLIVFGLLGVYHRRYDGGFLLIGIGIFFLIPHIFSFPDGWVRLWWPALLVLAGVLLILKTFNVRQGSSSNVRRSYGHGKEGEGMAYRSEDGYFRSSASFGTVHQIVLDPVFRGGEIKNLFGGTILDLRRSSLPDGETIINVDCTFGGIEIFMPEDWILVESVECIMGGIEDKRYRPDMDSDSGRTLVLRGKLTFGGIEIKS